MVAKYNIFEDSIPDELRERHESMKAKIQTDDLFTRYPSIDTLLREACYSMYIKSRGQVIESEMIDFTNEIVKRIHKTNIWREWRRRLSVLFKESRT